jgi:hypothetical protein
VEDRSRMIFVRPGGGEVAEVDLLWASGPRWEGSEEGQLPASAPGFVWGLGPFVAALRIRV